MLLSWFFVFVTIIWIIHTLFFMVFLVHSRVQFIVTLLLFPWTPYEYIETDIVNNNRTREFYLTDWEVSKLRSLPLSVHSLSRLYEWIPFSKSFVNDINSFAWKGAKEPVLFYYIYFSIHCCKFFWQQHSIIDKYRKYKKTPSLTVLSVHWE